MEDGAHGLSGTTVVVDILKGLQFELEKLESFAKGLTGILLQNWNQLDAVGALKHNKLLFNEPSTNKQLLQIHACSGY